MLGKSGLFVVALNVNVIDWPSGSLATWNTNTFVFGLLYL